MSDTISTTGTVTNTDTAVTDPGTITTTVTIDNTGTTTVSTDPGTVTTTGTTTTESETLLQKVEDAFKSVVTDVEHGLEVAEEDAAALWAKIKAKL